MRTAIDSAGRVLIPKKMRDASGLRPGIPVEARVVDGAVVLESAPTPVRIEKRKRFTVAVPGQPVPPLTEVMVSDTRAKIREGRGGEE